MSIMKSATFGFGGTCVSKSQAEMLKGAADYYAGAPLSRRAYRVSRQNGVTTDAPDRAFPNDGTYSWHSRTDGQYQVKYTEGPGDREWMEQCDRNYLARLDREKKSAARKQERETQLREAQEKLKREQPCDSRWALENGMSIMKSATFGFGGTCVSKSQAEMLKGAADYYAGAPLSRRAYRVSRQNGVTTDAPDRAFPNDGTYSWHSRTDGQYQVKYTEGPGDREWMEQCDRNYLARLDREKKSAARKQERETQLREAQEKLKREQQLQEEAEEQLRHKQQLKALESARSEAEAARVAVLQAEQSQTPGTKLSLSEASMKSATFGLSRFVHMGTKRGRFPPAKWASKSRDTKYAVAAYRASRQNGVHTDSPDRPFPNDGTYDWHKRTDGPYVVKYTEGPGDREWMEQCDRNYLARLDREKQSAARKQEREAQLREAQEKLKREQQLQEEAEEQLRHKQQLKALESARSEAEAARVAVLQAEQSQTPGTKLSLSEASMKSATFGLGARLCIIRPPLPTATTPSHPAVSNSLHSALTAYRASRQNGVQTDTPDRPLPNDGTYDWHERTDGKYQVKYTEGSGDREWMEQCDRNYLARLDREKHSAAHFGLGDRLCISPPLPPPSHFALSRGRQSAVAAYRASRQNGVQADRPLRPLPNDGTYSWHECTDGKYQVKYTEGPGDREWMEQCDRNYLARLDREKQSAAQHAPHAEKRLALVKQRIAKRRKSSSHHSSTTQSSTSHSSGGREQDCSGSPNHTGLDDSGGMQISLTIPYSHLTFGRKLGNGGFGEVFLGEWRHTEVAIKKLRMKDMSPETLAAFKNEAGIMARLNSPHTVRLYGITLSPEYTLVMEYLPKGSLYDVLSTEKALPWSTRSQIALDMSIGLAFLHTENILHQDLKSLNVLLDNQYRAKLADFGLSKIKLESSRTTSVSVQSVGTLPWKAPELLERGPKYNAACDMYSLGMTLWELSSGKLPFADAQDNGQIMAWVLRGLQETIPPETPEDLKATIQACWSLVPTRRPTATQVVSALKTGGKAGPATAGESIPAGYQVHSEAQSVKTDPNYPLHTPQAGSSSAGTGGYSLDSPSLRPPPPIPTATLMAEVLYPFQGASAEELSLSGGERVRVVDRVTSDWWRCEHDGQAGLVPSQYLRTLSSTQVPSASPAGYTGYTTPTSGEAMKTAGTFTATTSNTGATNQPGTPGASGDYQTYSRQ
jgi:serine/threonine protein kinase